MTDPVRERLDRIERRAKGAYSTRRRPASPTDVLWLVGRVRAYQDALEQISRSGRGGDVIARRALAEEN